MADRAELIRRLRIKADMITMGEKIEWGSDSAVMREAADALEASLPVKVKALDLSNLLKHAFISGRESVTGRMTNAGNSEAWVAYDPEECPAYQRVCAALSALEAAPAVPDAVRAILFAVKIDDDYDRLNFLNGWIEGDTSEWPEFAAAPEAPGQEAVACAKATSQTCAHYGGAPALCLFDTRTWAEGTTPERCSGCPEAPGHMFRRTDEDPASYQAALDEAERKHDSELPSSSPAAEPVAWQKRLDADRREIELNGTLSDYPAELRPLYLAPPDLASARQEGFEAGLKAAALVEAATKLGWTPEELSRFEKSVNDLAALVGMEYSLDLTKLAALSTKKGASS